MVARVDGQSGAVTTQEIDIDRGDVAFDVAVDSTGALVLVGGSGYTQNPHGASISEETNAFARVVRGQAIEAIASVPNGPRNSHVRTIAPLGGDRFVVGGMLDGPGTHSADGDRSLLRARGFLVTVGPR